MADIVLRNLAREAAGLTQTAAAGIAQHRGDG